jgi:hypothetical protein
MANLDSVEQNHSALRNDRPQSPKPRAPRRFARLPVSV